MQTSEIRAIISDADGTLVDSVYLVRRGMYETVRAHLTGHGIPVSMIPDFEEFQIHVEASVGGSARQTIEQTVRALYVDSPKYLKDIDFDALYAALDPIQDELAPEYVKAYPDLVEVMSQLGRAGMMLGIVTSGTRHHVVRNFGTALPELGYADLFLAPGESQLVKLAKIERAMERVFGMSKVCIVTSEDVEHTKPDPESIDIAMERLGIGPAVCVLLGDHAGDMEAGKQAGVAVRIGVTHGFDDQPTLEVAGATQIVHSLSELPRVLL